MKFLLGFLLLSLTITASAQSTKFIAGTVKDSRNEVLAGATVVLTARDDSSQKMTQATNVNGKFRFTIKSAGRFYLQVSAVGQKTIDSLSVQVDDANPELLVPPIILSPAKSRQLEAVVVTAKRPLVEQEVDRTVINVGSMIGSTTSNTLEVLGKTPGVIVDQNGNIQLNGRSGITVLIDGRQTYLAGQDLANYLKSIPGAILDKIELMDNPPSRYDAAGNAIINIRLKRSRNAGFTGSINAGFSQGSYSKMNESFNINYSRSKLNLFANLGYDLDNGYRTSLYDRQFYDGAGKLTSVVDLNSYQRFNGKGLSLNTGLDFIASASTTFGIQVNMSGNSGSSKLDYQSGNYNAGKILDTISSGVTAVKDRRRNLGTNLNFLHKFNKTGKEISGEVNYLKYAVRSRQDLDNFIVLADNTWKGTNKFIYLLPASFNIYTIKSDYSHPLANKGKFEAGIKSSFVNNTSIADYYNVVSGNQLIDIQKSNNFNYRENINAAYINAQKTGKRFAAQLGLRVEQTLARGKQLGNDSVPPSEFKKNYLQFFPSVFLNYKLDTLSKNSLAFSLTRRINRPNYQYLNPFLFFRDKYSYSAGNPLLVPQYQYRYELRFSHRQFLRLTLSYNRFTDVILQTTEAVNDILITRPQNIAKGYMVLLNTGVNVNPTKWWTLNSDVLFSNIGLNGMTYTERLTPKTFLLRINLLNQFKISKSLSAEAGGYFASQDINDQAYTGPMWRSNVGLQKKFLKDKATIRVSMEDIFKTWVYNRRSISLRQASFIEESESDTQRFGIGFSWRFGKDDFARKRKFADNASDEEKGRVQ